MRLLLVEDARNIADPITASFVRAGDTMDVAGTLVLARDRLNGRRFDVVVLDIDLPDDSNRTLLLELRAAGDPTPVLMAS